MKKREFETDFAGKKLKVEITDLANQANGSVLVRYGDTAVFATAVMSSEKKEGLNYFPLVVDYEERFYAAGMILGSRFIRREGRPSEEAVLTGRLIDRTIRPLFNHRMRNEVQVTIMTLSIDGKNDPDIPLIIASSLALAISDIPWNGPVGACRIGFDGNNFIINPTYEERKICLLDAVFCGKAERINMIETIAKEIPEDVFISAAERALKEIDFINKFQEKIIKEIGKEKVKIDIPEYPEEMEPFFEREIFPKLQESIYQKEKKDQKEELNEIKSFWFKIAEEKFGEENRALYDSFFEEKINEIVHKNILDLPDGSEKRPDGRKLDEIREIFADVGILPISHGSAVFFRGGTHILSVVTLGGPKDVLLIEGMETQTTKRFMHHYNFPPFSTGETGRIGSPGRREIGHGALAEKALYAVIPQKEDFPYTIRVVSECMASNGSTSQGSICASTLALMDAGVPIKNPVAGIAIGLMMEEKDGGLRYKILTDIQGPEDHHGDMDFKCAGTKEGITAIQMDVKVEGIGIDILKEAVFKAKKARMEILEKMLKVISQPREELSPYAPRILKIKIKPEKIGSVIGSGGRIINDIIEKTGAEIDIEQDGTIIIVGKNEEAINSAGKIIEGIVHEFEVGELASGVVTRLFDFGAMVDIGGGQEGLIHISELAPYHVEKVSDIVKVGDPVRVKVIEIDEKGRLNLSLKQADPNYKPIPKQKDDRGNNSGRNNNFKGRRDGKRA